MSDISALIANFPPELAKTAKFFQEILSQNQTVRGQVLNVLPNGDVFLFLEGQTLQAKTTIPLTRGEIITAQVKELKPNLILTLLPQSSTQTPPPASLEKIPLSDLKIFRDTLVKMNVLPSRDALVAAKAYIQEGLPLRSESFKTFLNDIKNLGIDNPEDVATAAKLQRLSLPLTPSLMAQMKEVFSADAAATPPSLKDWLTQVKNETATLPQPLVEKIQTPLQNVQTMLKQAQVIPQNKPEDIQTALQNNAQTTPYAFEKKFLTALSENFFDEKSFSQKLPDLLQLTRQALRQADTPSSTLLLKSLEKQFLLLQKNLPDKTFSGPSEPPVSPAPDSPAATLLRAVHLFDQFRALPSFASFKTPEFSKTFDQLHTLFQSFFPEKTSPPASSEKPDASSPASQPTPPPESKTFLTPPNFKEEIAKILQTFKEHLSSPNPANAPQVQKLQENTENLMNHILQKQFLSHSADDSLKMQPLDVPWTEGNKSNELNLFFKQQTTTGKNGTSQKSFQVFFSMDLAHLGYFEINIHDIQQNLEVSFSSQDEAVGAFFKRHSAALKDVLAEPPVKSVNVKTNAKKKNAASTPENPWPSISLKLPFSVDLIG